MILKEYGVSRAGIFGSRARGDARIKSDTDILVKMKRGSSLLDLVDLELKLKEKLGGKVDLLTYDSLHPKLRGRILREEVRIYEQ
ncbi:nucleotidyltransferase family protein [Candidatus Uhrbacteria bacterium]|nr:nucleotidyltransferase family protein [Candidatus Uhrbacteria bacterium]